MLANQTTVVLQEFCCRAALQLGVLTKRSGNTITVDGIFVHDTHVSSYLPNVYFKSMILDI